LQRSNPFFLFAEAWIASRSLSSGGHSADPLARKDGKNALVLRHIEPAPCLATAIKNAHLFLTCNFPESKK
jgi:hypothetical protein